MKRANKLLLIVGVALARVSVVAVALRALGKRANAPQLGVSVVVAALASAVRPLGMQLSAENLSTTAVRQKDAVDTSPGRDASDIVTMLAVVPQRDHIEPANSGIKLREPVENWGALPPQPINP